MRMCPQSGQIFFFSFISCFSFSFCIILANLVPLFYLVLFGIAFLDRGSSVALEDHCHSMKFLIEICGTVVESQVYAKFEFYVSFEYKDLVDTTRDNVTNIVAIMSINSFDEQTPVTLLL